MHFYKCAVAFVQEDSLNELLPFGEYRPPEQDTTPAMLMGMDAWELDRLLARLAMGAGQQGRRGNRAARHAARAARHAQQAAASESAAAGALFGPPMLALPAPSLLGPGARPSGFMVLFGIGVLDRCPCVHMSELGSATNTRVLVTD